MHSSRVMTTSNSLCFCGVAFQALYFDAHFPRELERPPTEFGVAIAVVDRLGSL